MRLAISICFFLIVPFCIAQEYQFETLPKGISQSSITKIIKDKYGFMWFGTRYGLNKFDGISYQQYPRDKKDSAFSESRYITDLQLDEAGNIWFSTESSGLIKYEYDHDSFTKYQHNPEELSSLSSNSLTAIFLEGDEMWVGIKSKGLNRLNLKTGRIEHFWSNLDDPGSLSSNEITSVRKDNQGNVWIGTWNGIHLYSTSSEKMIRYTIDPALKSNKVVSMYKGKHLWVGLENGLRRLEYKNDKYQFVWIGAKGKEADRLKNLTVLSMTEDLDGNLWIGTENGGLFYYNIPQKTLLNLAIKKKNGTVISNSVWSLYCDDLGIIWVGTFNGGVVKLDPHHHEMKHVYNHANRSDEISQNMVSSFAQIDDQFLWIGTDGGGLNKLDLTTNKATEKYDLGIRGSSNAVLDLLLDNNKNLWLATWDGMVRFDPSRRFTVYKYSAVNPSRGPQGNQLFDLIEDKNGNIWVASFRGGVSAYLSEEDRFISLFEGEEENVQLDRPTALLQQSDGRVWIGTEGEGIYNLEVSSDYQLLNFEHYEQIEGDTTSLGNNIINIIYEDKQGGIWVGTEGGGLNKFLPESKSFIRIDKDDNLPSNLIYAIEEDNSGRLWFSTNKGLCQYDPEKNSVRIFDEVDGIQADEFIKGSSLALTNGDLLFGGVNGFNRFSPETFVTNRTVPSVFVTSVLFQSEEKQPIHFGQIQSLTKASDDLELNHETNDFTITYSVLNYSKSSKNKYSYILEGYDDQWISPEQYTPARYTNVPPGNYVFKLKGSNNDGLWSDEVASLNIVIHQPWWNTYYAYLIYFIVLALASNFIIGLLVKRERLRRNLKDEHLELEKMLELDKMKSRFFANISHEFRTPLTLIISPLKLLIEGGFKGDLKGQYKMMVRNAERLLGLINQLLDLSKLESGNMKLQATKQDVVGFLKPLVHSFTSYAEKQHIDYKCEFPETSVPIYFEKDKLEKIVFNLLSNAFKYTQEFKSVAFSIVDKDDRVQLICKDTGIGIAESQIQLIFNRFYRVEEDKKRGTGIGLALTKELIELHKGTIQVDSKEGEGTTFIVELLKGEAHLVDDEKTFGGEVEAVTESTQGQKEKTVGTLDYHSNDLSEDDDLPIVLVVDDNEDMRHFIGEHLMTNYRILEARDGEEGLQIAREEIPDIVISDVMMPKMDGYELCGELKQDTKTCHIPFILLTAKASSESTIKGFELGADNYVTKPFNPKLLELRVRNILQSRENLKSQLLDTHQSDIEPSQVKVISRDKEFLKKLVSFVEDNISNSDLNIDDICKEMGLSRTQLYRKLKGLIGQSANEFIRSIRLKRAAQLIRTNEMNISEITYEVGFNDLQYFRFCFKKQFGVNPSDYANKLDKV